MTTFKAEVYAHQKRSDGSYNIKIRIIHKKQKKYLPTPYYVYKEDLTRTFKLKNQYYIDECDKIIRKYRSIIDKLGERSLSMNVSQIVDTINHGNIDDKIDLDIIEYGRNIAKQMRESGHIGNALNYENTLNNLVKFVGREKISVQEITVKFVNDWILWLTEMPAKSNRVRGTRAQSLYPSNLRAIINRAKNEYNDEELGIIRIPLSPFKKIKLPKISISKKRALDIKQLQALSQVNYRNIDRLGFSRFNLAKDMFLLSFLLIGMNEVDLFNCTDYKNGRITYQRTKTKNRRADSAEISIKVEPEAKKFIDKYRDPEGKRIFCFYKEYSSCGAFEAAINKGLKKIGDIINVDDLEFYAARHTWATIAANDIMIDKYIIHSALNHVDPTMKITDIYIKKSWDPIDQANRRVIDFVKLYIGDLNEPGRDKYLLKYLLKQNSKQK